MSHDSMKALPRDWVVVLKWGILSRALLFLLQVLLNNLIPDNKELMNGLYMVIYRQPPHHPLVDTALGGFDNWDSEHFIAAATYGYVLNERSMAFFPLFPFLLRLLSQSVFRPLLLFLPLRSVLLVSGFALNLIVFPCAALCLYLLTLQVSKDRRYSLVAAALFCVNPASVFMSALYTECLFALFTFSGLLMLERGRAWMAAVLFMLGSATRSNGIVLCGYIGYRCLVNIFNILTSRSLSVSIKESLSWVVTTGLQCMLVLLPFALFQYYGYYVYCTLVRRAPPQQWCNWTIPLPYSYVQDHYWNNGFLRFYRVDHISNFIKAVPMLILSCYSIVKYAIGRREKVKIDDSNREEKSYSFYSQSSHMRPYVCHLTFLLLFGTFYMYIDVITRFICSSSPVVYWFSSVILLQPFLASHKSVELTKPPSQLVREVLVAVYKETGVTCSKLVIGYFLVYIFVGFAIHCNFYDWL